MISARRYRLGWDLDGVLEEAGKYIYLRMVVFLASTNGGQGVGGRCCNGVIRVGHLFAELGMMLLNSCRRVMFSLVFCGVLHICTACAGSACF